MPFLQSLSIGYATHGEGVSSPYCMHDSEVPEFVYLSTSPLVYYTRSLKWPGIEQKRNLESCTLEPRYHSVGAVNIAVVSIIASERDLRFGIWDLRWVCCNMRVRSNMKVSGP